MKKISKNLTKNIVYIGKNKYLLILILSITNLWVMHLFFAFKGFLEYCPLKYTYFTNFCTIIIDVSIVLLVILCLSKGRLRTSVYFTYILTLIWSFCNVFYGRFFHQYLTLSAIGQSRGLTDTVVIKSMLYSFLWSDLYYFISLFVFLFICVLFKIKEQHISWKKIFCILSVPAVSLLTIIAVR